MQKRLGVDVLEQHKSNSQCKRFVNFVVEVIKKDVAEVKSSKFYSILIDVLISLQWSKYCMQCI
jgi:hypothetical protein